MTTPTLNILHMKLHHKCQHQALNRLYLLQMPPTSGEDTFSIEKPLQSESTLHPTIELAIADFPELPHKTNQHQKEQKLIPIEEEFSDDSMEDIPPAAVLNKPLQTSFKRPRDPISGSEETSTSNILTRE